MFHGGIYPMSITLYFVRILQVERQKNFYVIITSKYIILYPSWTEPGRNIYYLRALNYNINIMLTASGGSRFFFNFSVLNEITYKYAVNHNIYITIEYFYFFYLGKQALQAGMCTCL